LETDCDGAISSDIESGLDEDTVAVGDYNNVTGSQNKVCSKPQHAWNFNGVHPFIGVITELKKQEAPHVSRGS
jgi:hypothetical protein